MAEQNDAGWLPVFALPNISLDAPIERAPCALVPPNDPRIAALRKRHPHLDVYLKCFTNNFGVRFEPQMLLLRADAPKLFFDIGALASFRDAIAASVVPLCRAEELLGSTRRGAYFGDYLALYPWMIDKNFEYVVGRTPALTGLHDVNLLHAQSTPSLSRMKLRRDDLDAPLLHALLECWAVRYGTGNPEWRDVALMRSLNMAYHASLMPGASDATFHDVGRLICLWISAFEILVHTGPGGASSQKAVLDLLDGVAWQSATAAEKSHAAGKKAAKADRTLASWVLDRLYTLRNDFLHGNPVTSDGFALPGSDRQSFRYAAPIYRAALSAFLPLQFNVPAPLRSNGAAFGAWVAEKMDFESPGQLIERAIMTVLLPENCCD
ncbi:MAG: hypothetical protein WCP77_07150 [Roseococcus sp.]